MSEIDIEGAGIWQIGNEMFQFNGAILRPVLDVPRFKLPSGFGPRYREMFHESPLFVPAQTHSFPMSRLPTAGRYQYPLSLPSATGASSTLNRTFFCEMQVGFTSITYDRIAWHLTANGGSGSVNRLGFYQNDGTNGQPSTLILDAGTVVSDAGTDVIRTITISQKVTRGWFYTASCAQVGTAPGCAQVVPLIHFDGGQDSAPTLQKSHWKTDSMTGAFSSAPSGVGLLGNLTQPLVPLRVASYEL